MSWTEWQGYHEAQLKNLDADAKLLTKDHWLWTVLWWFLNIATCGLFAFAIRKEDFLERYVTTLGLYIFVPRQYPEILDSLLAHEIWGHGRQYTFAGWFVPILGWFFGRRVRALVGMLPMLLVYLLLPFPVFICYGRYRLELDADIVEWGMMKFNGCLAENIRKHARMRANLISGSAYLWSWPRHWVLAEYTKAVEKVLAE